MNAFGKFAILLAGALALGACGPSPDEAKVSPAPAAAPAARAPTGLPASAGTEEIRAAGLSKDGAYASGDADMIASFYSDDAVLMPPTARSARGPAAIRTFLRDYVSRLKSSGYSLAVDSAADIRASGNLGIRAGTYSIKDDTGTVVDTGKWLESWEKVGVEWRISRDIWNSDTLPLMMPDEDEGAGAPQ